MEIKFEGKRALVTGAGRGIGKAIALSLAKCGAKVVAVSRTKETLDKLKREEPSIETVTLDISNWDSTAERIKQLGKFDLLVNNAALANTQPLGDVTEQSVDSMFDVNVKAAINISQIVANGMRDSGKGGAIVNISSIAGICAFPGMSVYCCTKGAMNQMTKTMAVEYGPHKVRVNMISPSAIDTDMARDAGLFDPKGPSMANIMNRTPLGRLGKVKDVVGPVMFLLSDMASWITGANLIVDGGYTAW